MNIKCPHCGHDNQLGAIFCRGCGAKLDIDTIRPEVKDRSSSLAWLAWLKNLIMLLVFFGLTGVLAGLFIPYGFPPVPALDAQGETISKGKFDALLLRMDSGVGENNFVFAPAEITWFYNSTILSAVTTAGGTYAIGKLELFQDSAGYSVFVMSTKLFNFLPARFEVKGKISAAEKTSPDTVCLSFEPVSVKMGHIKMPAALNPIIVSKFAPLVQEKTADAVLKAVKTFELDSNGNYQFTLISPPKPAAPAKK